MIAEHRVSDGDLERPKISFANARRRGDFSFESKERLLASSADSLQLGEDGGPIAFGVPVGPLLFLICREGVVERFCKPRPAFRPSRRIAVWRPHPASENRDARREIR